MRRRAINPYADARFRRRARCGSAAPAGRRARARASAALTAQRDLHARRRRPRRAPTTSAPATKPEPATSWRAGAAERAEGDDAVPDAGHEERRHRRGADLPAVDRRPSPAGRRAARRRASQRGSAKPTRPMKPNVGPGAASIVPCDAEGDAQAQLVDEPRAVGGGATARAAADTGGGSAASAAARRRGGGAGAHRRAADRSRPRSPARAPASARRSSAPSSSRAPMCRRRACASRSRPRTPSRTGRMATTMRGEVRSSTGSHGS